MKHLLKSLHPVFETFLKPFSTIFFLVLSCQMIVIGLLEDYLFFNSNLESIVRYSLSLAFLLTLPIVLIYFLLYSVFPKNRMERWPTTLLGINIILILFGFLIYLFEGLIYKINNIAIFLIFTVLVLILCWWILKNLPDQDRILKTMLRLAKAGTGLAVFLLLFFYVKDLLQQPVTPFSKKENVIMIVLDGLGPQYLSLFNPTAYTPELEEIAEDSLLFTHFRTNFTYTLGFFKSLYSGTRNLTVSDENLLSLLQKRGVKTRWTVMHNNAVPDTSKIKYKGIRSAFITQNYTWIPNLMGLDYNVFRYKRGLRGVPMGNREQTVYHLSNQFFPHQRPLDTHLPNEILNLRKEGKPFFLLIHTDKFGEVGKKKDKERDIWEPITLEENKSLDIDEIFRQKFKNQDNTYTPEDAWIVNQWNNNYKRKLRRGLKSLTRFYQMFKANGWDKDTLLIITSDHGYILGKGKVWYGIHNEEEVTRVPLIIHYKNLKGVDDRLGETIDITQTILEFFGIKDKISKNAYSLLSENKKEYTTTMTNPSNIRKEYFFTLYTKNFKYVSNVYPNQDRNPYKAVIQNNFDTVPVKKGTGVWLDLDSEIQREVMKDF